MRDRRGRHLICSADAELACGCYHPILIISASERNRPSGENRPDDRSVPFREVLETSRLVTVYPRFSSSHWSVSSSKSLTECDEIGLVSDSVIMAIASTAALASA